MNILIADDHELFADLVKTVIETQGLAAAVRTFKNFDTAYAAVGTRKSGEPRNFDLILLDMRMPGMKGLTGLRRMIEIADGAPVAIISGMLTPAEAREVMRDGAAGFLPKTMPLADLAEAIKRLTVGERYIPKFLMASAAADAVAPRKDARLGDLTDRECEVLDELMQGWSNKQIGENLGISEITVKSHLMHLFRKIGARNRTDAMRIGLQLKARSNSEQAGEPPTDGPTSTH
jgi:DNA-binding NarL/FixJ family response regulator